MPFEPPPLRPSLAERAWMDQQQRTWLDQQTTGVGYEGDGGRGQRLRRDQIVAATTLLRSRRPNAR